MVGWNTGGCALDLLHTSLRACRNPQSGLPGIIGLQEVRRGAPGWTVQALEKWTLLSFQPDDAWRGTGVMFDPSLWQAMRRKACKAGSWYRMRHLETQTEFWMGVCYVPPHVSTLDLQEQLQTLLAHLPATTLPCMLAGDTNAPLSWISDHVRTTAVGDDGKGRVLLDTLLAHGFEVIPPAEDQLQQPTSKPRKEGAQGRRIDWMACKRANTTRAVIYTDSNKHLGTDHDALGVTLKFHEVAPRAHRVRLGPRVVVTPLSPPTHLDQHELERLAKAHTGPKKGEGYKDDNVVKEMFRIAKQTNTPYTWTRAFRARKEAHQAWRQDRVLKATQGDWNALRQSKIQKHRGWEVKMSEEMHPDDPHDRLHAHYSALFFTNTALPACPDPMRSPDFHEDELLQAIAGGKQGKSVGRDEVSLELLKALVEIPEGRTELLSWFNHLLHSGQLPEGWLRVVMVLIPKVTHPVQPKDTRPISIGSAVERVFSRMVLSRCKQILHLQTSWQCAGPHRQTADYLHTLWKLFEVEREWSKGLAVVKVDFARAFDTVRRDVLLRKLHSLLGSTEEYRVWHSLLSDTSCTLCSPWNQSVFAVDTGIRQGAIESPLFFALIMEWALQETIDTYKWEAGISTYKDLLLTHLAYMDDCILWDGDTLRLQARLRQFQTVLKGWGLSINLQKCGLYVSPNHVGQPFLEVDGERLDAQPSLVVMGVMFKVGANTRDLLQGTWERAISKFWSIKHLLTADTPIPGRLRLLDRVVGASILWNACAFSPEPHALEAINQLMFQMVVWMLKLRKHGAESWADYRRRSVRQARQMVFRFLTGRWSTQWLRRWWLYNGHVARGATRNPTPAPTVMSEYRTVEWWEREQLRVAGLKHTGRFFPKLCPLDKRMNSVCGGTPWRETALQRDKWQSLTDAWIQLADVQWASGNQFAIAW